MEDEHQEIVFQNSSQHPCESFMMSPKLSEITTATENSLQQTYLRGITVTSNVKNNKNIMQS